MYKIIEEEWIYFVIGRVTWRKMICKPEDSEINLKEWDISQHKDFSLKTMEPIHKINQRVI